jgi:putative integral membrane protein (TIGR02587 family)
MAEAQKTATTNAEYGKGLMRATGGALLFALPLLMTMEMWSHGAAMEPWRILIYLFAAAPLLLGLSYMAGFEPAFRLLDEILDAVAAFGVAVLLSTALLRLFGVLHAEMRPAELAGVVALCAVPASMGALLAGKQFGQKDIAERQKQEAGYLGKLFIMLVGALFLAFNVAPTEEMVLIAVKMPPWLALILVAVSIALLHLIVFELGFPGEDMRKNEQGLVRAFLTYTAPGYAIALAVSYYALWTFMRLDDAALFEQAQMTAVLAFPGALGAATARLVI